MEDTAVDPRQQLALLLEGRTDAEVNEFLKTLDDEETIGQVFDAMVERFHPERASGETAVIQWEIGAPSGVQTVQIKVENRKASWTRGAPDAPRVTLNLNAPDFLRLVAGQLDGMQAFMTGKLRLSGDMMFAQSVPAWFD